MSFVLFQAIRSPQNIGPIYLLWTEMVFFRFRICVFAVDWILFDKFYNFIIILSFRWWCTRQSVLNRLISVCKIFTDCVCVWVCSGDRNENSSTNIRNTAYQTHTYTYSVHMRDGERELMCASREAFDSSVWHFCVCESVCVRQCHSNSYGYLKFKWPNKN